MAISAEEKVQAITLAQSLRWSEVRVDMDFSDKSLKAQFKDADRKGARILIILNDEDLKKGLITVKDNFTHEETKIDENEIIDYIISNL